ncbi:hypothetical protein BJ165DRAFT_1492827 [Panaeolus papilionaceus]|nr:hypothetical protein BJ165DRAFT_1492827 [Panaeolus papilionaceus]
MHLWNACGDSVSQTLAAGCARVCCLILSRSLFIFVSHPFFSGISQTPLAFRLPHPQLLCRLLLPPALAIPLATLMQRLHLEPRPQLCLTLHPLVKAFDKSLHEI